MLRITYTGIDGWEDKCIVRGGGEFGGDKLNPYTECLGFAAIVVGIGEITEDNADEFYARLRLIEQIQGTFLTRAGDNGIERVPFSPQDVRDHIGLHVNTGKDLTRTQWYKHFVSNCLEDEKRNFRRSNSSDD